ncbi:hypothetical protein [Pseudomonas asiatica]|uniref:Uncharacterized protein n=1 Tax=Pseudomonas asiatica TaxID=2219225 RepID=A0A9X4HTX7_9PSED|nr:hypothetical protein [Pseudomonas asiatica]MDD2108950.1 hypothetical protein [Pseudomonas asiatica]
MALKLNERYPGRFNGPTAGYPQGSFKNRTTPTAKDGSYLEQDWANDKEGFFQSLLSDAGFVASGAVDAVGASQFFDAMKAVVRKMSLGVAGSTASLKMTVATASSSATVTADEIVVKSAIGGLSYIIPSFNKTINLAAAGAGGMDTGSAPVNGWVALYAIYNPTSGASSILAVNSPNAVMPAVYGGANMPSGYTASALLTVVPTNASGQLKVCSVRGRDVFIQLATAYMGNASVVDNPISIAGIVPANAVLILNGEITLQNTAQSAMSLTVKPDASAVGQQNITGLVGAGGALVSNYSMLPLNTDQVLMFTSSSSAGTPTYGIYIGGYRL